MNIIVLYVQQAKENLNVQQILHDHANANNNVLVKKMKIFEDEMNRITKILMQVYGQKSPQVEHTQKFTFKRCMRMRLKKYHKLHDMCNAYEETNRESKQAILLIYKR